MIQVWVPNARRPWHPPGAGVPLATIKPVGVGVRVGWEGTPPNLAGCLPQLPSLSGSQENKGFPLFHLEKSGLSHPPGPWEGWVTGQGPQGDSAY